MQIYLQTIELCLDFWGHYGSHLHRIRTGKISGSYFLSVNKLTLPMPKGRGFLD